MGGRKRDLEKMKRLGGVGKDNLGILFVVAILLVSPSIVSATVVSFDMTVIFEGPGVPTNPSPWVNATFNDGGSAGTVDLTISAPGLAGNPEKISGLYFNLDPALDPTQLLFSAPTLISGAFKDPVISLGVDSFKADGDGFFDILLDFDPDGPALAFNGGDVVQYTITLASLTADSFCLPSTPDEGVGEYCAAAHLLSLGVAQDSAWVATPEPATILLIGLGGIFVMRKRRH
ncbi:MAG: PEP-CTERM sorting domain-containing protein [Planctomycetota bacterium]|jgi:hypothetical protein